MIPQNEREAEFLKRIEKLEKIIFKGNTFDDNYGNTPKEPEPKND